MAAGDYDWSAYFKDMAERFDQAAEEAIDAAMKKKNSFPGTAFNTVAGHSLHGAQAVDSQWSISKIVDAFGGVQIGVLAPPGLDDGALELRGVSRLDNPHKPGTVEHRDWESHWLEGNGPGSDVYRQAKAIADERLDRLRDSLAPTPQQEACQAIMDEVAEAIEPDRPVLNKIVGKNTKVSFMRLPDLDTMRGTPASMAVFDEVIDFQLALDDEPSTDTMRWRWWATLPSFTTPRGGIKFINVV